jgi:hypothetical protein
MRFFGTVIIPINNNKEIHYQEYHDPIPKVLNILIEIRDFSKVALFIHSSLFNNSLISIRIATQKWHRHLYHTRENIIEKKEWIDWF